VSGPSAISLYSTVVPLHTTAAITRRRRRRRRRLPICPHLRGTAGPVYIIIHCSPAPAAQQLGGARNILPSPFSVELPTSPGGSGDGWPLRAKLDRSRHFYTPQLDLHHRRRPLLLHPLASARPSLADLVASLIIILLTPLAPTRVRLPPTPPACSLDAGQLPQ
jgi:hypothetical protein